MSFLLPGHARRPDWSWKSKPFELAPPGDKVLDDCDHLGGFEVGRTVPAQQDAVRQLSLAFLDAHLRGRYAARRWLGSIEDAVGDCRLLFRRK